MVIVSYKEWKGNNRFFLNGKYMTGSNKDNFTLGAAWVALIIGFIVYSLTLCRFFLSRGYPLTAYIPYVLYFIACYFKLKTTFTDPGVIPRGTLNSAEEAIENGVVLHVGDDDDDCCNDDHSIEIPVTRSEENISEGKSLKGKNKSNISIYKHRYCKTCKIMRPPKSSHCGDCDNCVKEFDHHCYFVGNCIGRRNHKYFFMFLGIAFLMCFFSTLQSVFGLYTVISENPEIIVRFGNQLMYWIVAAILIFMGVCCCNRAYCRDTKITILIVGFIVVNIGIIMSSTGLNLGWYENPAVFVGFIIAETPFTLWIFFAFYSNVFRVSRGLTHKQETVIDRELGDFCSRKRIYDVSFKDKIANIREFLFREICDSQIEGVA